MFCQVLLRERLQLYLNKNRKKIINLCMQIGINQRIIFKAQMPSLTFWIKPLSLCFSHRIFRHNISIYTILFRVYGFRMLFVFYAVCTVFPLTIWFLFACCTIPPSHATCVSVGVSLWYVHYFLYVLNCLSASQDLYE